MIDRVRTTFAEAPSDRYDDVGPAAHHPRMPRSTARTGDQFVMVAVPDVM
jgi:hypothetical protein